MHARGRADRAGHGRALRPTPPRRPRRRRRARARRTLRARRPGRAVARRTAAAARASARSSSASRATIVVSVDSAGSVGVSSVRRGEASCFSAQSQSSSRQCPLGSSSASTASTAATAAAPRGDDVAPGRADRPSLRRSRSTAPPAACRASRPDSDTRGCGSLGRLGAAALAVAGVGSGDAAATSSGSHVGDPSSTITSAGLAPSTTQIALGDTGALISRRSPSWKSSSVSDTTPSLAFCVATTSRGESGCPAAPTMLAPRSTRACSRPSEKRKTSSVPTGPAAAIHNRRRAPRSRRAARAASAAGSSGTARAAGTDPSTRAAPRGCARRRAGDPRAPPWPTGAARAARSSRRRSWSSARRCAAARGSRWRRARDWPRRRARAAALRARATRPARARVARSRAAASARRRGRRPAVDRCRRRRGRPARRAERGRDLGARSRRIERQRAGGAGDVRAVEAGGEVGRAGLEPHRSVVTRNLAPGCRIMNGRSLPCRALGATDSAAGPRTGQGEVKATGS